MLLTRSSMRSLLHNIYIYNHTDISVTHSPLLPRVYQPDSHTGVAHAESHVVESTFTHYCTEIQL